MQVSRASKAVSSGISAELNEIETMASGSVMPYTHPAAPHGCGVSRTHGVITPKPFSTNHILGLMMGTGMLLWICQGTFPLNLTVSWHFWKRWGMHYNMGPDSRERLLSRGSQWKDGALEGSIRAPAIAPELTPWRGQEWVYHSENLQFCSIISIFKSFQATEVQRFEHFMKPEGEVANGLPDS